MAKRVLALALCFIMLALALVGCAEKDENDKGAYVYMYLTDMVYDMDPAHAYENGNWFTGVIINEFKRPSGHLAR